MFVMLDLAPIALIVIPSPILIGFIALVGSATEIVAEARREIAAGLELTGVIAILGIDLESDLNLIVGIIGNMIHDFRYDFITAAFLEKHFDRALIATEMGNLKPFLRLLAQFVDFVLKTAPVA